MRKKVGMRFIALASSHSMAYFVLTDVEHYKKDDPRYSRPVQSTGKYSNKMCSMIKHKHTFFFMHSPRFSTLNPIHVN